jgi:hypothetical protein
VLLEKAIVHTLAVFGITDNRVANVFEVTAYLVFAAGLWCNLHQRVAALRVAINVHRQLDGGQRFKVADCFAGRAGSLLIAVGNLIKFILERMVDGASYRWMPAHNSEIGFFKPVAGKVL